MMKLASKSNRALRLIPCQSNNKCSKKKTWLTLINSRFCLSLVLNYGHKICQTLHANPTKKKRSKMVIDKVDTMSTFKEIFHLQSGVHIYHESVTTQHLPVSYFNTMFSVKPWHQGIKISHNTPSCVRSTGAWQWCPWAFEGWHRRSLPTYLHSWRT